MGTIKLNYDTLKKENWSEKEDQNVKLVLDFVQNLMNDHNFKYVKDTFGNQFYKQHNKSIPDGLDNLITYVSSFAKKYPDYSYDVKHIYADGDFVIFHSQATLNAKDRGNDYKGLNIIDTWKIQDGMIVEHWDALQAMDTSMRVYSLLNGGKVENNNGVY